MKKLYSVAAVLLLMLSAFPFAKAQTINTTLGSTGYNGANGAGAGFAITFALENNSGGGILLTDLQQWFPASYTGTVDLYYSSTSLSGAYTPLTTPTWTLIGSGSMTSTVAGVTPINWTPSLNFLMPQGAIYRFAVFCSAYCSYSGAAGPPAPSVFTAGGVSLYAGDYQLMGGNVGWGSTNNPRWFTGLVTFVPAGPCTSPPTPGTTTSTTTSACLSSNFTLSLTGQSGGTGQTYQFQSAAAVGGPYTNIGGVLTAPSYIVTATSTMYYRCAVTCGSATTYSTPIQVTVPGLFPAGTYTINSALPTGGTNFQTFNAAVAAISCGTTGPVIFNVDPASGPYNEQVSIPAIATNSATNTITFNCNNRTLSYTNTSASNFAILRLDGADYIRIKKLNVTANTAGTAGFGILLTNNADYNLIDSCTVDVGINTTTTAFCGVLIGSASAAATTSTIACDSNTVSNSTIIGGYYCTVSYGPTTLQQYNQFVNNVIRDYYFYGSYLVYNNNLQIVNNEYHRPNRTTLSTFYGVYNSTGNTKSFISRNRIHNPFGAAPTNTGAAYGIYNSGAGAVGTENLICNNILYNMDGNGAHYCLYAASNYGRWLYNTVNEDFVAATAGLTYGYYQISSYTGNEVKNNIINLTRGGAIARYCVYHSAAAYTTVMTNNDFNVSGATNNVGYNGGTVCPTLASWITSYGQNTGSVSLDPVFVAPTTGNLTPTNLTMDNIGIPVTGVTTDITGFTRNTTTPDAGAFEFNNCNPPTGLTATGLTVSSANLSWTAVTGSIGYEYVVDLLPGNPAGSGTATAATSTPATGLNSGTTYYLHVRNKCGTSTFSPWVTIPFTTCTQATITPASSITFCAGNSVILNANAGSSYQWQLNGNNITGATSGSYTANTGGNYTVTVTTSSSGCVSTSAAVNVQVTTPPSAIAPTGTITICPATTTVFSAPSGVGLTYQWLLNGNPISGATGVNYSAGLAGNYTVTVSSGANCNATTATPTTLALHPIPPAVITTPPTTSVCPGATHTLNANTGSGLNYQWLLNNANISGATLNPYSGTSQGTFTVKITNTVTGCTNTSNAVTITPAPVPPASVLPLSGATGCDSVMLSANAGPGYTYQWKYNGNNIPGGFNIIHPANLTGNYSVTVTGTNGCFATSSNAAITVNPSPFSSITYSSPLVFCFGGAVALNTYSMSGYSYQWTRNGDTLGGATGNYIIAANTGTYSVIVTSNNGCVGISTPVNVKTNDIPLPVISRNVNVLSTGSYTAYQWHRNSAPIPGATGQTYTFIDNGSYTVYVTDTNGCNAASPAMFINNNGVNTLSYTTSDIKVYPNPATDVVNIDAPVKIDVVIQDPQGRVVIRQSDATSINLQNMSSGIYMLMIVDKQGNLIKTEKLTRIGR